MKKILFLNTTKLAVLSAMLLLAVFCTIGMSFTPAEEGENVGNPNDSTYVTGPRRSSSSSCSGASYENATDYGRVEVKIMVWDEDGTAINIDHNTVGSVTLTGNTAQYDATDGNTYQASVTSSNPTSGTDVFIDWNSGAEWTDQWSTSSMSDSIIKACHTLTVTMEATTKGTEYEFYGWTKHIMQNDTTTYLPASPSTKPTEITDGVENTDVIILGDVDDDEEEEGFTNTYSGDHKRTWENSNVPHKVIYYAHFAPPVPVNITLKAAENGTYTYDTDETQPETISTEDDSITTSKTITLTATPASGYKFFGWYEKDGNQEKYLSYDASWSKKFTVSTTIYAKFIPADWATYIVRNMPKVQYYDFQAAANAADASTDKVFLPLINGVVPAGNHTIPSGVTLLIPYNDENTVEKEQPTVVDPAAASNCKPYRTLTLTSGTTINVKGSISVSTKQYATNTTYTNNGVRSWYGFIYMNEGSIINIEEDANLYAWGYISGEGEVIAKSGSFVHEMFQVTDFRGGTRTIGVFGTGGMLNNSKKVFFFQSYYIQNIETKLTIKNGAILKVAYAFNLSKKNYKNTAYLIGTKNEDAMFTMSSGKIVRSYDRMADRIHYTLEGECELKYVSVSFSGQTVTSENYVLPLNSNMDIKVTKGSSFTITQDMSFLPNTKVDIEKDATITINKDCNVHIYDTEQWIDRGCLYNRADIKRLAFVGRNHNNQYGTPYPRTIKDDAKFNIDGTLIVNGALYTTQSGADICSTGTGIIKYNGKAGTETLTHQDTLNNDYQDIPITAAQLHNDTTKNPDYHYTQTAGAVAGDIFTYSETYGRWRCERTITWEANGGTIEPTTTIVGRGEPLSLYFPESLPTPTRVGYTFNGWFTAASGGTQITTETIVNDNVTYYAQWILNIVGTPLDIVDADNTNKTLTINANGWASSGWPYTINDTPYEKTARAADRTLVIPYGDKAPNEEIVIEVKNKSDEVISNHIYKVPFVYTGDATMSGTDENSIVFVKSGTLTVGDASAKEIYVAPGAALQVNENGTLDVKKLVLRTTPFEAAILTNNGTIAGQVYYSRIARDTDFHLFAIPAGSNTAGVVLSDGTSAAVASTVAPYGNAWQLREYNTARRAAEGATGANWNNIGVNADKTTYSDVAIEASKGYELRSGTKYYREYLLPVTLPTAATSVQVTAATGAAGAAHAGWNILCSPYTDVYAVEYDDPATGIKVSWQQTDGSYIQEQPKQIKPAVPFAYQANQTGTLAFDTNFTFAASAPRKQSAAEALTETEWVHLDIFDAYGEGDETSLFVHPTRFEQTYKTGIDMAKQSLTAARPIIYSTHAYGDMAFAGVADSLLENGIDLVVYSPSAQELTFSLRENKFLNRLEYLWLADNETGARTDLLMNDYTFRADAGTAKGRFVLNGRFKAPQISTGIGNTQTDYNIYAIGNNIAISGVEQGTPIYVFDAVGHMIYTTAATTAEVIVPAPCAGVYMLTIGGQTAKLVINQ